MGYYNWADRQLRDLMSQIPNYTRSEYPAKQLGLANQLFNGRMFGAADLERNIFSNQANNQAVIQRNATDSSALLAAAAAGQGATDQSLSNLQTGEKQNKYAMLQNLDEAYGAMTNEDRMVEQQKQLKFQNLVQLKGAQAANKLAKRKALWNTVGGIANLGLSAFTSGAFGGGAGGGGTENAVAAGGG